VFCTEQSLHDRARRINPAAVFMPNVGDHRHFSTPTSVADPRLAQMKSLKQPRIVFSGQLAPHKVDLRLVERLAADRPDWSFVLIGPEWEGAGTREAIDPLRRLRNVALLGHVPYNDLPAYLHAADVLIIPYVRNTATRAVFPLKFFEYLATGKPVVASPLPSLLPYHEAVALVDTPRAWVAAIEAALRDPQRLAEQRQVLARRHTWNARLRAMERVVAEALDKRD
jgi:glycosyltransferase involved in cell wall biosynthesis